MYNNLKKNAVLGLSWTTLEYIILIILQVGQLSILARILTPADFGIFAIGTFFSTLGNRVFALGMGPALIQKEGDITEYLDPAWTANLLISLGACFILIFFLPIVIHFYFNEPKALLPSVIILSVVAISGFNNIAIVLYLKRLEMKTVFFYNIIPKLIGIFLAIIFSIIYRNYWGLVIGIVAEFILRLILSYLLVPRKPKFVIDKMKIKELYTFGGWLQLKNIFSWAVNNIDVAIVGATLNTSLLGFYNRATTLARLPETQVTKIINVISFPLYSAIRNNENKLQKAIKSNNDLVLIILVPLLLITLLFGEETVKLILGIDWLYLTTPFQLLILAISIQAYLISYTPILRALGFPKYEFVYHAFKIIIMLILLYPLTIGYGIIGTSFAILIATLISAIYMFIKIRKLVKLAYDSWLTSLSLSLPSFCIIYLIKAVLNLSHSNNYEFIVIVISIVILNFIILYLFYLIFNVGPFISILKFIFQIKSNK